MHIGAKTAIKRPALLLIIWTSITSPNIFTSANTFAGVLTYKRLNVDLDPTPSPDTSLPLSAGASVDRSLLLAQIGGILGAYLVSVCIIGIAILIVSRNLRNKLRFPYGLPDNELAGPSSCQAPNFELFPISLQALTPGRTRDFSRPSRKKDMPTPFSQSVIEGSSVDDRIAGANRDMSQWDLEDIYVHVMEQDEAKAAGVNLKDMPPLSQLQHSSPVPTGLPQRQSSPKSRKEGKFRPAQLNFNETNPLAKAASRATSLISSLKSPRLARMKSIRKMQISSPILDPDAATCPNTGSDEEPAAPKYYYPPPPPPPVPKDQVPHTHFRNTFNLSPHSPERSIAEKLGSYASSSSQQQQQQHQQFHDHRQNVSQVSISSPGSTNTVNVSVTSVTSQTPLFPSSQPKPTTTQPASSSVSASRALPLRQFERDLQSTSCLPALTKTTILERTQPPAGPRTDGLNTPWSVGAVPYSPYQPFSPVTPITPRLVTRDERKAKKNLEPRRPVLKMVDSDKDLWHSAY